MMVLREILKGILKAYFRLISSLMKSNFGKFAMKYKIGLKIFLFLQIGHRIFGALAIFCIAWPKGKNIFLPDRKYIAEDL